MDHFSCIYVITNKINGRQYVGQTSDYTKRINSHLSALRNGRSHCRYLQYAFNKYGEDAFEFSVLEKCEDNKLNEREQYWIQKLGTLDNGYNMCDGGNGIRGFKFTKEQKEHIRNALKGKTASDIARQHMRERHADFTGSKNPNYGIPWADRVSIEKQIQFRISCSRRYSGKENPNHGKKMSEEQKKKLSDSHKRYYVLHGNPLKGRKRPEISGANSYRAHAVICVNTGVRYETVNDAAAEIGVNQSSISMCCSGKMISCGHDENGVPMLWRYADEYVPMTDNEILEYVHKAYDSSREISRRIIICVTTGEVFLSMKDACEKYHIDPSSLSGHCRGRKLQNGCGRHPETNELLKWKYIE